MSRRKNMVINFNNDGDQIQLTRKFLKKQILCPEMKFRHHVKERTHVLELLKHTVEEGESNSLLLVGPRGSGKTTLVNSVLKELSNLKSFKDNAIIVNLNGLVHTDDRLALKDATRQMQLENVVGDKVFGSFAENLTFLLECLKSGDKKRSKPIIFILDEFDLFCSHNKQTLLYSLFDVSQSKQAPICVLGITSRIDVVELLEKRVKSRFSHRQIFLFPKDVSGSSKEVNNHFDDLMDLFKELLSFPNDENVNKIELGQEDCPIDSEFLIKWNKHVLALSENKDIIDILKNMHKINILERNFRHFLAVVISSLSENHTELVLQDFIEARDMFEEDVKTLMLEELSVLELCLVIAIKHQIDIFGDEPVNFELIYNRYLHFARNASIESVQKPVVMKAFEHLKNMEIIIPVTGTNQKVEKEYQLYKFAVLPEQINDAVRKYDNLPTDVAQWAQSSIL